MSNRRAKVTSIFIIVISIIFISPIPILVHQLKTFGEINKNEFFYFSNESISSIQNITVNSLIGNVNFNYFYPPQEYAIEIAFLIEMKGENLKNKLFSDYFVIYWENQSGEVLFNLTMNPSKSMAEIVHLVKNLTINVNLRADIEFNIASFVQEGSVQVFVPFPVQVNDISFRTLNGNIRYVLDNCILEGNISGIGDRSNIELRTYNVQCTRSILWHLKNNVGELKFDIFQSIEMGANVTAIGELETNAGRIHLIYRDFSSQIGSAVALNHWEGDFPTQSFWSGFTYGVIETIPRGYLFTSDDFPAQNNFNISLHANENDWQPYLWDSV